MAKRTYLLTLFFSKPATEHARIAKKLEEISVGETTLAQASMTATSWLFNSSEAFDAIGRSIENLTLNSDTFLLVEVGPRTWQLRLGRAAGWLKNHHCHPDHQK